MFADLSTRTLTEELKLTFNHYVLRTVLPQQKQGIVKIMPMFHHDSYHKLRITC